MIARFIFYAFAVGILLSLAALLLEQIAAMRGWPRRWVWALALGATAATVALAPFRISKITPSVAEYVARSVVPVARTADSVAAAPPVANLTGFLDQLRADANRIAIAAGGFETLFRGAWLLGTVALLGIFIAGQHSLRRRRRQWRPADIDGVRILVASDDGPAVVGVLNSEIVLPEWALALDRHSIDLMIRHEREHQLARDPLLIHLAGLVVFAMPWNVAAWWMVRRLRLAIEVDCDARVLGRGTRAQAAPPLEAPLYGELLLTVVAHRSPRAQIIVPGFLESSSSLSRRIAAMYPRPLSFARLKYALAASVALTLVAVTAFLPVPRLLAQQGPGSSVERLVGSPASAPLPNLSPAAERELMMRYFPDVLRGEGPESVAFVRDADGKITGTMNAHLAEQVVGLAREKAGVPLTGNFVYRGRDVALARDEAAEWSAAVDSSVAQILAERAVAARAYTTAIEGHAITAQEKATIADAKANEAALEADVAAAKRQIAAAQDPFAAAQDQVVAAQDQIVAAQRLVEKMRRASDDSAHAVSRRDSGIDMMRVIAPLMKHEMLAEGVPLSSEARQLAEHVTAVDVVRHSAGELGGQAVNIFYVTRHQ